MRALPAEHYEAVARIYEGANPYPGKVIAQRYEVPISTVHRWIRECRRVGLLPPAEKGRTSNAYQCNHRCPVCCRAAQAVAS